MPEMMKALIKAKSEVGIWMGEVPIPKIEPDEVLIKIQRASICGTDMHIYKWDDWAKSAVPVPMVTGHEYGGEVVEVGSTVRRVKVGDRVSGEGHVVGNRSRNARSGRFHLDPDTKGIGVNMPGAFAEYLRLPEFNVIPLADDFPLEIAAILDPLGNAVHTALSFDLVGEDILITGAGPIGVMSAAVAVQAGARRIAITDINEWRLKFAKKIVPEVHTVNVLKQDLRGEMKTMGLKEGFDVGLEMSGAAPAFEQMIDAMIMGGNIAMLGLPPKPFPADFGKIVLKALTIRGIYGRQMYDTWYKMLALLDSGLNVEGMITDRFAARDYQAAFDLMLTGEAGKVILDWTDV